MENNSEIEITQFEGMTVVAFRSASLGDIEQLRMISKEIDEYIEAEMPRRLVVDFEGVKFFSSQVLGLLLDIRAKMQSFNGEVVISAINPQLHRVFKITNLDKIFRFFPDRESAIKTTNID